MKKLIFALTSSMAIAASAIAATSNPLITTAQHPTTSTAPYRSWNEIGVAAAGGFTSLAASYTTFAKFSNREIAQKAGKTPPELRSFCDLRTAFNNSSASAKLVTLGAGYSGFMTCLLLPDLIARACDDRCASDFATITGFSGIMSTVCLYRADYTLRSYKTLFPLFATFGYSASLGMIYTGLNPFVNPTDNQLKPVNQFLASGALAASTFGAAYMTFVDIPYGQQRGFAQVRSAFKSNPYAVRLATGGSAYGGLLMPLLFPNVFGDNKWSNFTFMTIASAITSGKLIYRGDMSLRNYQTLLPVFAILGYSASIGSLYAGMNPLKKY